MTTRIIGAPPFDFALSLAFLRMFRPMTGEQDLTPTTLTKAVEAAGTTVVAEISGAPGGVELTLSAAQPLTPAVEAAALDRVRFFLSLDDDLTAFRARAARDPAMAPVMRELHGLHQAKLATPFEATCWSILAQRCPLPSARRLKDRLTDRWGGALEHRGRVRRAFPTAAALAGVSPEELARVLGNAVKAQRIGSAVAAFANVDEAFLRHGPRSVVEQWLRAIDGVGPWSAAFVLLRGLGRMDRIAGAEGQLQDAVATVYGADRVRSPRDVEVLAASYGEQQGYWAYYLRAWDGLRASGGQTLATISSDTVHSRAASAMSSPSLVERATLQ